MTVEVPKDFQQQGFSGRYHTRCRIQEEYLGWWLVQVPCRLPLNVKDGPWLALEVDRIDLTLTMVRLDSVAEGEDQGHDTSTARR